VDEKRINEKVIPLLRPTTKGEDKRLSLARQAIEELVIMPHPEKIDPIDKLRFLFACGFSDTHLRGYATLDELHIESIRNLISHIERYANDTSQKRPLVFLMLASPGAGKSHFIKRIAAQLRQLKVGAITYNMAGLRTGEDMIPALDNARNLKVEDRIPLLFLDEFDSSPAHVAMLLPLLWEGEITIGQRDLKLGKVIIVLAGSDPSLPGTMDDARSMRQEVFEGRGKIPKMIDLLSRINGGVVTIPPFYDASRKMDRRADKVCIAAELLRQRFGDGLREVPLCLLRFVALAEFRYGVRSIAHLVSMIPFKEGLQTLKPDDLDLPFEKPAALKESSLAYHLLDKDQGYGVEKLWKDCSVNDCQMPVKDEDFDRYPRFRSDGMYQNIIISRVLTRLQNGKTGRRLEVVQRKSPAGSNVRGNVRGGRRRRG
jgi:hypothetical protein